VVTAIVYCKWSLESCLVRLHNNCFDSVSMNYARPGEDTVSCYRYTIIIYLKRTYNDGRTKTSSSLSHFAAWNCRVFYQLYIANGNWCSTIMHLFKFCRISSWGHAYIHCKRQIVPSAYKASTEFRYVIVGVYSAKVDFDKSHRSLSAMMLLWKCMRVCSKRTSTIKVFQVSQWIDSDSEVVGGPSRWRKRGR
jgi:hypothetical protein